MKNTEEYLKEVNSLTPRKDLYEIGKQIQIDAYNQALEDIVEKTKTKIDISSFQEGTIIIDIIDVNSILKLKK